MTEVLSLAKIRDLCRAALIGAGAAPETAEIVALSVADAEADGIRSIGLDYMPVYCRHLEIGKVIGDAVPAFRRAGKAGLMGDAKNGFCHAAYAAGEDRFYALAREQGIAGFGLVHSYASGVIGWFSERMAAAGLVGLTFTNASPTMAPFGGKKPIFGTNPIALGVPREGRPPLVIDLSPAATTRLNIKEKRAAGEAIPLGWGLDSEGNPCSDPATVLDEGSVAPSGGHKGSAMALLVEIMAAGLTGARWSFEASDLGNDSGGPPEIGQFFIAIHPETFAGEGFAARVETLLAAMLEQDGVRLPGDRRQAHRAAAERDGLAVPEALLAALRSYAARA